jgi:hypothetical protein
MNTQRHVHASIIASPVSFQFLVTLCALEPNTRALQGQAMDHDAAPAVAAMPAPIDYADPGCARVAPQDPNLSAIASAAPVCGDPKLSSSGAAEPLSAISILLARDHLQQQHCLSLDPSCVINHDFRMVLPCQCKCIEGQYPADDELFGMTIECACTTCGPERKCRNVIEACEYMERGDLCHNCDASKRLMEAQAKVEAFKEKEAAQSQAKD